MKSIAPASTIDSNINILVYSNLNGLNCLVVSITALASNWECGFVLPSSCPAAKYGVIASFLSAQNNITYTAEAKMTSNSRKIIIQANAGYTPLPVNVKFSGFILYI